MGDEARRSHLLSNGPFAETRRDKVGAQD